MSHIVQTSERKRPGTPARTGSRCPEARLDQRVVERGAMTCRRAGCAAVHPERGSRWSAQRASVRVRMRSKRRLRVAALAVAGSRGACSHPRREKPSRTSTVLPGARRAHEEQAERAQRGLPDAVEVEPGAALRSAGGRARALSPPGCRPRRATDSGTPSRTTVPCAWPCPSSPRRPAAGPSGRARCGPPQDRSSTTRALRLSGTCTGGWRPSSPTVISHGRRCPGRRVVPGRRHLVRRGQGFARSSSGCTIGVTRT